MKYLFLFASCIFSMSAYAAYESLDQVNQEMAKVEQYLLENPGDPDLEKFLLDLKSQQKKMANAKPKPKKKPLAKESAHAQAKSIAKKREKIAKAESEKRKRKWDMIKEGALVGLEKNREPANKTAPEKIEESPLKIGMMVDLYYMQNLNNPVGGSTTPLRNYDQTHNDFTMNLIELNAQGSMGAMGYYVDLDFGEFADQNTGEAGDGISHNIGQAYLTYSFDGYTLSAGKMYTNVGYEVAKSQDNWNYSRSFSFSLGGPFWHEGISIAKSYESGFGWGFFVYDDWDTRTESNDEKTYSAQLKYSNDQFSFVYNYITGRQNAPGTTNADGVGIESAQKMLHEFNAQWDINENWSLALNGLAGVDQEAAGLPNNIKDGEWKAWVAYVRWQSEKFGLTARVEQFTYSNSLPSAQDASAIAADDLTLSGYTLTGSYNFNENTEFRIEARQDEASEEFYLNDGSLQTGQTTLSLSWMYRL